MAKKSGGVRAVDQPFIKGWLGKTHFVKKQKKAMKLMAVKGKKTGEPAIIYKKTFDSKRHVPIKSMELYGLCKKKGLVPVSDRKGKYLRLWTTSFAKSQGVHVPSGFRMKARKTLRADELREKAKKMHLKKYSVKKTKKALAASIRRAEKGGSRHKKHGHKKHGKKGKKSKKFSKLRGEEESESSEE